MTPKRPDRAVHPSTFRRPSIGRLSALVLASAWLALQAAPVQAKIHQLKRLDVDCYHSELMLMEASGVPTDQVHTYSFEGVCHLKSIYNTGPVTVSKPQVVATAKWDGHTKTYTEIVHLRSPITTPVIKGCYGSEVSLKMESITCLSAFFHVGTGHEEAVYRCDYDPVVDNAAHCNILTQSNRTGWSSPTNPLSLDEVSGGDGFAWKPRHSRPILLGAADAKQAINLSKSFAKSHPPIRCNNLEFVDASDVLPGKNLHKYTFNGTCQLYHTRDGNDGLKVTHVKVFGDWNVSAHRAMEAVIVYAKTGQGGGNWATTYTCTDDPWIGRGEKCSSTEQSGHPPPVFDPITDLANRHPVALGMANGDKAIQMSKAHQKKSIHVGSLPGPIHKKSGPSGTVKPFPNLHATSGPPLHGKSLPAMHVLAKKAPQVRFVRENNTVDSRCSNLRRFLVIHETIRNNGGPLAAGHAKISVTEAGGAKISSPKVSVPPLAHGASTMVTLYAGTMELYRTKVPGIHRLPITLLVDGKSSTSLLTKRFPSRYCQRRRSGGGGMHVVSPSGMRKLNPQPEPPFPSRR